MNPTRRRPARPLRRATAVVLALALAGMAAPLAARGADLAEEPGPSARSLAVVDLTTEEGARLLAATWRYRDAHLEEVPFRAAGADGQPTGPEVKTWDVVPRAGGRDYDDSSWEVIAPASLAQRRGTGRVCFAWYRVRLTIPERLGDLDPTGSTVVFETSIDDYAEVWVDGELPRRSAQSGGSVVAGWNAPNRLVIARGARPGQSIQLAVFGMNGPISGSPTNFIWMREARVELHPGSFEPISVVPQEVNVTVVRLDPAIDAVVPRNAKLFKLAEGLQFGEGPVWSPRGELLFSDPNANRIYRYAAGELEVFRERSGYAGEDVARYRQPGSNGLAFDRQGRLTAAQHGNRRIVRWERDGKETVLADRYEGRRLNSPNDLVYRSDGSLYFTDPPFGLPGFADDPARELPWSGVYRLDEGRLVLLTDELAGPNGIAFSPDESTLYVGNWDPAHKVVRRYPVRSDGTVGPGEDLVDLTAEPGEEAIDGVEVDRAGRLYVSGPGGLWIASPDGTLLGRIEAPRLAANFAWGDDGRSLYLTARDRLYRLPLLADAPAGAVATAGASP